MQDLHTLQQEVELVLVPGLIRQSAFDMPEDEAQHRGNQPVVRAQLLGELNRQPRGWLFQ